MAQYRITSPDGQVYKITAPDGASQEELQAYVQHNLGQPQTTAAPTKMVPSNPIASIGQGLEDTASLGGNIAAWAAKKGLNLAGATGAAQKIADLQDWLHKNVPNIHESNGGWSDTLGENVGAMAPFAPIGAAGDVGMMVANTAAPAIASTIGEKVAGTPGAIAGAFVGPGAAAKLLAKAGVKGFAGAAAKAGKLSVEDAATEMSRKFNAADQSYGAVRDALVGVEQPAATRLFNSFNPLYKENLLGVSTSRGIEGVLNDLKTEVAKGGVLSGQALDKLKYEIGQQTSGKLRAEMNNRLHDFVAALGPKDIITNQSSGNNAAQLIAKFKNDWNSAKSAYAQGSRMSDVLEKAGVSQAKASTRYGGNDFGNRTMQALDKIKTESQPGVVADFTRGWSPYERSIGNAIGRGLLARSLNYGAKALGGGSGVVSHAAGAGLGYEQGGPIGALIGFEAGPMAGRLLRAGHSAAVNADLERLLYALNNREALANMPAIVSNGFGRTQALSWARKILQANAAKK